MLVEYIRESCSCDNQGRGNPIGCVVAIAKDKIGWSLTNPKDHFNKALAVKIAAGRAERGRLGNIPTRFVCINEAPYLVDVATLLQEGLLRMEARAERYFK